MQKNKVLSLYRKAKMATANLTNAVIKKRVELDNKIEEIKKEIKEIDKKAKVAKNKGLSPSVIKRMNNKKQMRIRKLKAVKKKIADLNNTLKTSRASKGLKKVTKDYLNWQLGINKGKKNGKRKSRKKA